MQSQKNQQKQTQQSSNQPIHNRQKIQPFANSPKRRKLSYSINNTKQHNLTLNVWAYKMKKNKRLEKNNNNNINNNSNNNNNNNNTYNSNSNNNNEHVTIQQTLQNDYKQIQIMRQQQKNKWRMTPKYMMAFFPTYTTIVDNHINFINENKDNDRNRDRDRDRDSQLNRKKSDKMQIKLEQVLNDKKKLGPLRKHSKTSRRSQPKSKKQLNLSFFNVQKVCLVPITTISPENKRQKNTLTASIFNTKRTFVIPRQSFDQFKTIQPILQNKQLQNNNNNNNNSYQKISLQSKTLSVLKNQLSFTKGFRPFNPPFQRYYYFDFLWKIAYSNGFKHQFIQNLNKKYKVYIGPGNNSMLIKTLFKRRQSWWSFTDKIDQANFIWTQIKVTNIFNGQKNNENIKLGQQLPHFQQLDSFKKNIQYRKNYKILNNHLLQKWSIYYDKNKDIQQKLPPNFSKRNKLLKLTNSKLFPQNQADKIKIHNHLPRNYVLGNKKALFATMKKYYEINKQQVFQFLPLTFHIENGLDDKQYFKFLQYFYKKNKQSKQSQKLQKCNKIRNIWIIKPGQFTNRGNGITVCKNLQQIKNIVKNKKKLQNGNNRTYIIQQYLDRPFLYCKRKFDIRHYMLITCINGQLKGYWYQLGYIRTTSYQYSIKNSLSSVHLTNDAVQKLLPDYGKYEKGNKLSYQQFQKYLQKQYKGKYSFYQSIYPQMKKIAHDSMRACALMIDQQRKGHNFQIFGFDFMIDSNFHPWLIQINTNPCLQLSCPVLMDVIPDMVENALKIGVDSVLTPPYSFTQKRPRFNSNILQENKFELLYDSSVEEEGLKRLFHGGEEVKLNFKQLQKDQDQVYQDDGVQLQD